MIPSLQLNLVGNNNNKTLQRQPSISFHKHNLHSPIKKQNTLFPLFQAKALYSYTSADEKNELSLQEGDTVTVYDTSDKSWFLVASVKADTTLGYVPASYLQRSTCKLNIDCVIHIAQFFCTNYRRIVFMELVSKQFHHLIDANENEQVTQILIKAFQTQYPTQYEWITNQFNKFSVVGKYGTFGEYEVLEESQKGVITSEEEFAFFKQNLSKCKKTGLLQKLNLKGGKHRWRKHFYETFLFDYDLFLQVKEPRMKKHFEAYKLLNEKISAKQAKHFQYLIFGSKQVGKTSLVLQFVNFHFLNEYEPTVEDRYKTILIHPLDGSALQIEIIDIGSGYKNLLEEQLIKSSQCFALVFSYDDQSSFNQLDSYMDILIKFGVFDKPILLIGNKKDVKYWSGVVTDEEVSKFLSKYSSQFVNLEFLETSAKFKSNVFEMFTNLTKKALKPLIKSPSSYSMIDFSRVYGNAPLPSPHEEAESARRKTSVEITPRNHQPYQRVRRKSTLTQSNCVLQ